MTQTTYTQLVPIASMNEYRWHHKLDQFQSHLSSKKRSRNRGVFLSDQGWQKLIQAGVLYNEFGQRYTYEQLSECSHLDERTVSRLLSGEVKVDKNTLKTFFRVFNLSLESSDYTSSQAEGINNVRAVASNHAVLSVHGTEFEQLVEELRQLKQRVREYDRLLHRLGLSENQVSQQLGA